MGSGRIITTAQDSPPVPLRVLRKEVSLFSRLYQPVFLFIALFCFGTFGYFIIKQIDGCLTPELAANNIMLLRYCTYQTAILLTGVGFSDVLASEQSWLGTGFTVIMAFFGFGFLMYFISTITAFIVGGELSHILERKRMLKRIAALSNHYIVCGGGESGRHVVSELTTTQRPFVVLETDGDRVAKLKADNPELCCLQEDATDDDALIAAGIDRAAGLVSSLPNDKDNLLIVITARQINPRLRIISRCIDLVNKKKLIKAGADSVVAPAMIGGLRMVSEMVRPTVTTFLDTMLRDQRAIRFEDVRIPPEHSLIGKTLADARLPDIAEVNIIATREGEDKNFVYNPHGNLIITANMDVVLIGAPGDLKKIRTHLGGV